MGSASISPEILSMETSTRDDSYFRIRYGDRVKYIIIAPNTMDSDQLFMPLHFLPELPYDGDDWNVAHVAQSSGKQHHLQFSLECRLLRRVTDIWHPEKIDCLSLQRVRRLTLNTFECIREDQPAPRPTLVAKVARFEWEVPRIERETRAYRLLQDKNVAPRFLGHIHEEGRVIGFLLEKVNGLPADIEHLSQCEDALSLLHSLGLLHGDINRHNFIVGEGWTKIIDFESCQETLNTQLMNEERLRLSDELRDNSGRGAGFLTDEEDSE